MNAAQSDELTALSAQFTDSDYAVLEARLKLRAACLNWTGDPLQQPADVVIAEARGVLRDRKGQSKSER